jgi:hypothetical protein
VVSSRENLNYKLIKKGLTIRMDAEAKLAIFEKYDLSKSALIKKAKLDYESSQAKLYHGMATMLQSLVMCLEALLSGEVEDVQDHKNMQNEVYRSYGWLQSKYQGIDWNELDSDDLDFEVFFKMNELINELGHTIDAFLKESRKKSGQKIDSKHYSKLQHQIRVMRNLMLQYKEIKTKLEKQTECEIPGG